MEGKTAGADLCLLKKGKITQLCLTSKMQSC